jgi:hypothetical protein
MRTLLVVSLAATLIGCSCIVPPQAGFEQCSFSNEFACFDKTTTNQPAETMGQPIELKPTSFKTNSGAKELKSAKVTEKRSSAHVSDRAHPATKPPKIVTAKVEPPESAQSAEPDSVLVKAKSAIAAKLDNPASAEFVDMKRAVRKNTLGQSVDTICGHVKGKTASGEDTGDKPFLYLVKDDDAYLVDGPAGSAAATAYRNICS